MDSFDRFWDEAKEHAATKFAHVVLMWEQQKVTDRRLEQRAAQSTFRMLSYTGLGLWGVCASMTGLAELCHAWSGVAAAPQCPLVAADVAVHAPLVNGLP